MNYSNLHARCAKVTFPTARVDVVQLFVLMGAALHPVCAALSLNSYYIVDRPFSQCYPLVVTLVS